MDETEEADRLRYLLRFLRAGIALCVEYDDSETPALTHMIEDRMSWGLDSPDCLYLYCRVRAGGTYRIAGTRGGARAIDNLHIVFERGAWLERFPRSGPVSVAS